MRKDSYDIKLFKSVKKYVFNTFQINKEDLEKKITGVYKISCLKNGKLYIGQSQKNLYYRMIENLKNKIRYPQYYPIMSNDLSKFGLENFKLEIIAITPNPEYAPELEKFIIATENKIHPDKLYNRNNYRANIQIVRNLSQQDLKNYPFFK